MAPATTGATAVSALLWFRKGLRVHDSPALLAACAGAVHVYPVFCIDPWFVASGCVGQARLRFLAESLADLDASLRARGSRLIVLEGKPEAEIPRALEAWGCARLVYEQDEVEP
ncbi:DNA photolyase, partial [Pavlovales sp. CCMP2436]